ncbi:unnamed protein product, partial [Mesorhabditis spiculigera]
MDPNLGNPPTETPEPIPIDRQKVLEDVEARIPDALKYVSLTLGELAKEKQTTRAKFDEFGANFKKHVQSIERDLSSQLDYLSQICIGQAHKGTTWSTSQAVALDKAASDELHRDLSNLSNRYDFSASVQDGSEADMDTDQPQSSSNVFNFPA